MRRRGILGATPRIRGLILVRRCEHPELLRYREPLIINMSTALVALSLLVASATSSAHIYLQLVPGDDLTHIIVVNQSDRPLEVWDLFNTNSIHGQLSLEFSQGNDKFHKIIDGYPVGPSESTVHLIPGSVYGMSFPTDYLRRSYRLTPGCYEVRVTLRLPHQDGATDARGISTTQRNVCFSSDRNDTGA